tara:strand:+ start:158 stop:586 length:429 start_codon:yes stop_codon:yes gene_type:complete
MSYKAALNMKPVLVYITLSTDSVLANGDPVAFDTVTGSSNHGVTISNGVVTVPSGYQWFCQAQIISNIVVAANINWYLNGSVATVFAESGIATNTGTSITSNVIGHCAVDAISSSANIELRSDAAFTVESDFSFMLLIGYPS